MCLIVNAFLFIKAVHLGLHITSWHYSGFGIKKCVIFRLSLNCQIQNYFSIKPNAQIRCSGCYAFGFLFISIFTFLFSVTLLHRFKVRNNFKISIMSEFKQFKTPEIIFIDDCDVQYNFRKLLQSLSYRRKVQFYLIRICLLVLFFLLMYGIQRLL